MTWNDKYNLTKSLFMKTCNSEFMNEKINVMEIYLPSIEHFHMTKGSIHKVKT